MKRDIDKLKRTELLAEVREQRCLIAELEQKLSIYKAMTHRHRLLDKDAWDIRNMMPMVEFGQQYLKGAVAATVYRLCLKGAIDSYTIFYSNSTNAEGATLQSKKRFTMIPLTRRNLAFAEKFIPKDPKNVQSLLRISKLSKEMKLEVTNKPINKNA